LFLNGKIYAIEYVSSNDDFYMVDIENHNPKWMKLPKPFFTVAEHSLLLAVCNSIYTLGWKCEKYDTITGKWFKLPNPKKFLISRPVVFNNRFIYATCLHSLNYDTVLFMLDTLDEEAGWKRVLDLNAYTVRPYAAHQDSNSEIIFIRKSNVTRYSATKNAFSYSLFTTFENFSTGFQQMVCHKGILAVPFIENGNVNIVFYTNKWRYKKFEKNQLSKNQENLQKDKEISYHYKLSFQRA